MMQNVKYAIAFVWGVAYAVAWTLIVQNLSIPLEQKSWIVIPAAFAIMSTAGIFIGTLFQLSDHWND